MRTRGRKSAPNASLLRAAVHSPERFALVYDEYAERVLRFLARQTFDVQVAYDLHAEVFAIAFERRQQFRGTTRAEEQAWLYAIARSELSAYWRRGKVEAAAMARLKLDRPALDDEALERLEDLAELDSMRPALAAALAGLPEDQRDAVRLRVLEENAYEQIAEATGVSQDVARARVSRGLRALGEMLGEHGYAVEGQS